jgi:hypothetical protein
MSPAAEELFERHIQGGEEPRQRLNGDPGFAAFYAPNVGAVDAGEVRQLFLRQHALPYAQRSQTFTDAATQQSVQGTARLPGGTKSYDSIEVASTRSVASGRNGASRGVAANRPGGLA